MAFRTRTREGVFSDLHILMVTGANGWKGSSGVGQFGSVFAFQFCRTNQPGQKPNGCAYRAFYFWWLVFLRQNLYIFS